MKTDQRETTIHDNNVSALETFRLGREPHVGFQHQPDDLKMTYILTAHEIQTVS